MNNIGELKAALILVLFFATAMTAKQKLLIDSSQSVAEVSDLGYSGPLPVLDASED